MNRRSPLAFMAPLLLASCSPQYKVELRNEVGAPIVVEVIEKLPVYDDTQTVNHEYQTIGERPLVRLRSDLAIGGQLIAKAKLDEQLLHPWQLRVTSHEHAALDMPIDGSRLPLRGAIRRQDGALVFIPLK